MSNPDHGAVDGTADTNHQTDQPRAGQAAFNALWAWRPDIARHITGTDADPYYNDDNLPAFHHRVTELLSGDTTGTTDDPADNLRRYAEGATHHPPTRGDVSGVLTKLENAEKTAELLGEALTGTIGEGTRHWPRENRLDGTADDLDRAADAYQEWISRR